MSELKRRERYRSAGRHCACGRPAVRVLWCEPVCARCLKIEKWLAAEVNRQEAHEWDRLVGPAEKGE